MNQPKTITKRARNRARDALEKRVVSHALRYIAFLIKTENQIDYKSVLTPEMREVFEKLWVDLADKVYFNKDIQLCGSWLTSLKYS